MNSGTSHEQQVYNNTAVIEIARHGVEIQLVVSCPGGFTELVYSLFANYIVSLNW